MSTNRISSKLSYILLKNRLGMTKQMIGLVCPYGIGDTYLICLLLREYIKENHLSSIRLILKPGHEQIAEMFGYNEYVYIPENFALISDYVIKNGSQKSGEIFVAHPNYIDDSYFTKLLGYKDLNLIDIYKIILKLDINTKLDTPSEAKKLSKRKIKDYEELGIIPGKSILLCPEANSTFLLATDTWIRIYKHYLNKGYKVYTSVLHEENHIPGTIPIKLTIREIRSFAEYVGTVVSLRSGICDVLSNTKCKLQVVYPNSIWSKSTMFHATSLKSMGLSRNVCEIDLANTREKDICLHLC